MKNTSKHEGLRNQLAKLLEEKGITDKKVLEAIKIIPRHLFLDSSFEDFAYQDKAFPIAAGQTISQPYTVAYQTQLLQVKKDDKILEIGTGSGYQTAVLCVLGAKDPVPHPNLPGRHDSTRGADIEPIHGVHGRRSSGPVP